MEIGTTLLIVSNAQQSILNATPIKSSSHIADAIGDPRIQIMWCSLVVSILAFVISAISLWLHHRKYSLEKSYRKIDKELSVEDQYWHRSVILPYFVDKLLECVDVWIEKVKNVSSIQEPIDDSIYSDRIDLLRDSIKRDLRQLCSRTKLLCTSTEETRSGIRNSLDEIEDILFSCLLTHKSNIQKKGSENFSYATTVDDKVLQKVNNILQCLISQHKNMNT